MRAVMLDVPDDLLRTRRETGLDRYDEMWEGVLHMVPPPSGDHQELEAELLVVLRPLAKAVGLRATPETGYFAFEQPDTSYRVPDLVVTSLEHRTHRGVEGGAVLVVEIRSPGDESYEKLPFYAAQRTERVAIIEPDTLAVDLFALHEGELRPVPIPEDGHRSLGFAGLTIATISDGHQPGLCLRHPAGESVIWHADVTAGD